MSRKKIVFITSILVVFFSIGLVYPSKENIPCLLFHHVWKYGRVTPDSFEQLLIELKREGYESIFISDLLKHKDKISKIPSKAIILTFDDGYLDNYIHAFPILKKHGFKATIFIITSKTLTNLQNGYLSSSQLEEMIRSGYIEIQSHSHTHEYCYISDRITTFNSPFFWDIVYAPNDDTRLGIPIYERKSSLITNCWYDDHNLRNYLAEYVSKNGGEFFFLKNSDTWEKRLLKQTKDYKSKNSIEGHWESNLDYENRVINELSLSKRLIENKLKISCIAIAWPWGQYTNQLISIADSVGYKIYVTADRGTNYYNEIDLRKIKRIEAEECGIERLILGKLPLVYSIRIRLFIYEHYLLGYIYDLIDSIID